MTTLIPTRGSTDGFPNLFIDLDLGDAPGFLTALRATQRLDQRLELKDPRSGRRLA